MRKLYKADLPISTSMQFDNYITHIILANNKSIDYDNSDSSIAHNQLNTNNLNNNDDESKINVNNNFTSSTYSFIQSFIKNQLVNTNSSETFNNLNTNDNMNKSATNYFNLNETQKLAQNGSPNSPNNNNLERYHLNQLY